MGHRLDESSVWVGRAVHFDIPEARPAVQRQDVRQPRRFDLQEISIEGSKPLVSEYAKDRIRTGAFRLVRPLWLWGARRRQILGINVFSNVDESPADQEAAFEQTRLTLEYVRRYDERRFRWVALVHHIMLWPGHYSAANRFDGIVVSRADLVDWGLPYAASVMVHEATHVRIERAGVPYLPRYRDRIERLCIEEQIQFLRAVPDGGEAYASAVEAALGEPWWTTEQRDRTVHKVVAENGLPEWLAHLIVRVRGP